MKKILLALVFLISTLSFSQKQDWGTPKLALYQDLKLATTEDDFGNIPYTMDILARAELAGLQREHYFFSLIAEYEYAELAGGIFTRYGMGVGWTFNQWNDRYEFSTGVTINMIHRWATNHRNVFGLSGDLSYQLFKYNEHIKLSFFAQAINREDLRNRYGDTFWESIKPSLYVGLKYDF